MVTAATAPNAILLSVRNGDRGASPCESPLGQGTHLLPGSEDGVRASATRGRTIELDPPPRRSLDDIILDRLERILGPRVDHLLLLWGSLLPSQRQRVRDALRPCDRGTRLGLVWGAVAAVPAVAVTMPAGLPRCGERERDEGEQTPSKGEHWTCSSLLYFVTHVFSSG